MTRRKKKQGYTQHIFDPLWRRPKRGRKPSRDSGVPHLRRAEPKLGFPVHVTTCHPGAAGAFCLE